MDKRLFNDFLRFLASNLDYIFIAIAILLVLLLITSLLSGKKRKKVKLKDAPDSSKVRKQIEATEAQVHDLMAAYEERTAYYEQHEEEKKEQLQNLEEAIAQRDEALRNLEGAPEELQQVLASLDPNAKVKKKSRWGSFFFGLILGIVLTAAGIYAYQNWNSVRQIFPAEWVGA